MSCQPYTCTHACAGVLYAAHFSAAGFFFEEAMSSFASPPYGFKPTLSSTARMYAKSQPGPYNLVHFCVCCGFPASICDVQPNK